MKYYALVVRPVFQRAVIEIEAENRDDGYKVAAIAAAKLPDERWQGRFQPGWYAPYAAEVIGEGEYGVEDPQAFLASRSWMRYAVLEANLEIAHGAVLLQPWQVHEHSPREDSAICEGWSTALGALYEGDPPLLQNVERLREDALTNNIIAPPEAPVDD